MQLFVALPALFLALFASASHSPRSVAHAHRKIISLNTLSHCGQWDSVTAGHYSLYLNQWGASGAAGRQCAQVISLNGSRISWQTTYNWIEGTGIKSFTNVQLNVGINKQLSAIKSMPASWAWSMSSTSIVADVAFDLFTSDFAGGSNVNEVMIWLANYNTDPLSYDYTYDGKAVPTTSTITIAGHDWRLYIGTNGANKVFSFSTASGPIESFHGDIFPFFKYLMKHQGVASSQYLITAQAGSESVFGHATMTTTKYSLAIQ